MPPARSAVLATNGEIAFASARNGNQDIFVMNSDGSDQAQVTSDATVSFRPTWSPDATKIAFASTRLGLEQVFVMNADGSGQTQITSDPGGESQPVRQHPNGQRRLPYCLCSVGLCGCARNFSAAARITSSLAVAACSPRFAAEIWSSCSGSAPIAWAMSSPTTSPTGSSREAIIHRIVGGDPANGFVLRGDNNAEDDRWYPGQENIEGKLWLRVPSAGLLVAFVRSPAVLAAVTGGFVFGFMMTSPGVQRLRLARPATWRGGRPSAREP